MIRRAIRDRLERRRRLYAKHRSDEYRRALGAIEPVLGAACWLVAILIGLALAPHLVIMAGLVFGAAWIFGSGFRSGAGPRS